MAWFQERSTGRLLSIMNDDINQLKIKLANEATSMLHGKKAAQNSEKAAKEAFSSGDRVQSEYCYQFTDHYYRLISESELKSFSNENSSDSAREKIIQNEEQILKNKEKNISLNESENISEQNTDSIETVSFIAKPAKKTSSKVKKEVS